MTWSDELQAMLREAEGDLGLFLALVALRRTEAGSAGREWGVLSVSAPTYAQQLRVARVSLQNAVVRIRSQLVRSRTHEGLFTDDFLREFSAHWAPQNVANDPTGLNAHHATNLVNIHADLAERVLGTLRTLPGGGLERDPVAV